MPANIIIMNMRAKYTGPEVPVINTCCNNRNDWQNDLSPFALGPVRLYGDLVAQNMENAWQYAKVYQVHADSMGNANMKYWQWAQEGWDNPKAVRYPMGRGAKPLYSLWQGKKLGYIEARKQIYAPLYIKAVRETQGYQTLKELYETQETLIFRDFDGWNQGTMSLTEVLNNPSKKMGHAFVLKMLLTNDEALKQINL